MSVWPDRRILDLFRIDLPIIQAPMAGASTPEMAIAVAEPAGWDRSPVRSILRRRFVTRSR